MQDQELPPVREPATADDGGAAGALDDAADPQCPPAQLGMYAMRSQALAARVAANPAATSRILRCIARRWPGLRAHVARHPAIDRALSCELVRTEAAALFENPALPPRIAGRRSLPRRFLRKLLAHEAAPAWLWPALAGHAHAKVRELAAGAVVRAADSEPTRQALLRLARDEDGGVRAAAAAQAALPAEEALRCCGDVDARVRAAAAGRGELPEAIERQLAGDAAWEVRSALAAKAQHRSAQRRLLRDSSSLVRRQLAGNPALAGAELAALAEDASPDVRLAVARHPAASAAVLLRLLEAPDGVGCWVGVDSVYVAALAHPAMPAEGFARVAASSVALERQRVARCPRAPRALLLRLATRDPDPWVRAIAVGNLAWDPDDAADAEARAAALAIEIDDDDGVRAALVNRTRDASLLARRAGDRAQLVRYCVADSASAPAEVLAQLVQSDPWMVETLARHPATPLQSLREILRTGRATAKLAAVANPALPLEALFDEVQGWPAEHELVRAVWLRLSSIPDELEAKDAWLQATRRKARVLDRAVAWCAKTPLEVWAYLGFSSDLEVRTDLAKHTADPMCLELLMADENPLVRREVAKRLGWPAPLAQPSPSAEQVAPLVRQLSADPDASVRRALARHARDPAALVTLRSDADRLVALEALGNPALPQRLLLAACRRGGSEREAARSALRRLGHPAGGEALRSGERSVHE